LLKKLARTKVIKFLTSFKLAVVCLFFLMILTFWGTLHQIEHGLYVTQSRMFNSWFFTTLGFIPFPGARTILWAALINILSVIIFKFQYKWQKLGVWFIHLGMILMIVSGGITLHFAQESSLTLEEGQGLNIASDYHLWELAFWTQSSQGDSLFKEVESYNLSMVKSGQIIKNNNLGIEIHIKEYFPNSQAFRGSNLLSSAKYINASKIADLKKAETHSDPAKNIPGIIFQMTSSENQNSGKMDLLLFGGEVEPTSITLNQKRVYCMLRRKQYELPLTLKLIDFIKKDHMGMSMAKVEVSPLFDCEKED